MLRNISRIAIGQRRLAQHVIRVTIAARFIGAAVASASSMVWPVTNWLPSMRMARSTPLRIRGSPPFAISLVSAEPQPALATGADQFAGNQQTPGGGIDEQRWRFAQMRASRPC